jgi:hypothetical protein
MKVEENGSNSRSGRIIASAFVVMAILLGTMQISLMSVSAAPVPFGPAPVAGTRTTYELNIEVDYFPGLLTPEVIDAFNFLESYFETRNISTELDFNSTNNVIDGNGYNLDMRAINRQYHDQPTTHIYFVVARLAHAWGSASNLGVVISLDITGRNYENIRFLVMHEVGHCIGIGLQDDGDEENYPSWGFMAPYNPNIAEQIEEYRAEDWNSSFATDGIYGNQTRKTARMWNRYSVVGEIYDNTADVMGVAIGDISFPDSSNFTVTDIIYLIEVGGSANQSAGITPYNGTFTFRAVKPGNYTLVAWDRLRFIEPVFVNVTEREIKNLGDIAIEIVPVEPPEPVESPQDNRMAYILVALLITVILVLAFALWVRKNDKDEDRRNRKIIIAVAIATILLIVPSYFYLGPNDRYDAVTVNEFYDDQVDSNNDGIIDAPFAWHSYGAGDRVVIRDRIETIWFQPDENRTYIFLPGYSGKYMFATGINIMVLGNVTSTYSRGDIIMVQNRMAEYEQGNIYPEFGGWTLVV